MAQGRRKVCSGEENRVQESEEALVRGPDPDRGQAKGIACWVENQGPSFFQHPPYTRPFSMNPRTSQFSGQTGVLQGPPDHEDSCLKRCDAVLSARGLPGTVLRYLNLHSQILVPNPRRGTRHQSSMSSCWCDMDTWASSGSLNVYEAETLTLPLGPLHIPQLLTADGHPLCLGQNFGVTGNLFFPHTHI